MEGKNSKAPTPQYHVIPARSASLIRVGLTLTNSYPLQKRLLRWPPKTMISAKLWGQWKLE